ncbi:MAG: hypothetical protein COZ20_05745 [Gallionellales bacterium CG_4_10_14_3_um_filter_54_96]|nr:MAG: hypothetical protein COZ20_05745 [Gallionellales bacterium CG_4_10_14_3_um_filter_54_96]
MKKWKQELDRLPTDEAKRKEAIESSSTEIVLQFMREEIYARLESAKVKFSQPELNIEISPASTADISTKYPIVYMTVRKQSNGNSCEYSLKFNQQEKDLIIDTTLIGKNGHPTLGNIALEGESPTTLVEAYIKQLGEQFQ